MHRKPGRPALGGRLVTLRIPDGVVDRADALAASMPTLTMPARVLARAAEIGLEAVERELAGAVGKGPKNGAGRPLVVVEDEA